jgi:hypothetical protein
VPLDARAVVPDQGIRRTEPTCLQYRLRWVSAHLPPDAWAVKWHRTLLSKPWTSHALTISACRYDQFSRTTYTQNMSLVDHRLTRIELVEDERQMPTFCDMQCGRTARNTPAKCCTRSQTISHAYGMFQDAVWCTRSLGVDRSWVSRSKAR